MSRIRAVIACPAVTMSPGRQDSSGMLIIAVKPPISTKVTPKMAISVTRPVMVWLRALAGTHLQQVGFELGEHRQIIEPDELKDARRTLARRYQQASE
jgi:hypothetical protein